MTLDHPILLVLVIAVLAPSLVNTRFGRRIPAVVLEMLFGIIVGPHLLGWVPDLKPGQPVMLLGQAGLAFLFFLVGMDIDLDRFRGPTVSLAVASWCVSMVLAIAVAALLYLCSIVHAAVMVTVALTTTAT